METDMSPDGADGLGILHPAAIRCLNAYGRRPSGIAVSQGQVLDSAHFGGHRATPPPPRLRLLRSPPVRHIEPGRYRHSSAVDGRDSHVLLLRPTRTSR